jgi:cysteine-rich repeat protein
LRRPQRGRAACAVESGYTCTGEPSLCITTCGDGVMAGNELCDDGNLVNGDGCSAVCTPNTGESCGDPLVMSQAVQAGGAYTWTVAGGAATSVNGDFACDPNTHGPDMVVAYVKTSATLANGGELLHVTVDTPSNSTTAYYLNVEVKGGACNVGAGTSLKCLWYKDNWDLYLDVPPGTYYIWVQKNSPATATVLFPAVTIKAEEIVADASEGEACFAPYTDASPIYTPPAGAGLPHTWAVPPTINSFDMGATWGEPGSISCDNTSPYGDIHGVDAVIEYDKVSPTSVLKVDVQNLDPTLTQSDLDVEVLNVCDPQSAAKVSRNCRANKDTFSFTAPSPAGPVYLWVATEATSEELNGAQVQITEIFPGPGESWPTAQPLVGSGPIAPTSTQRLDAPSCFAAAGNIHWYKYTLINDALSLAASVAGTVGIYDAGGQEKFCVADAAASPIGLLGSPGDVFYIAVQSPTAIASLTLNDVVYEGVQGDATDMMVTFPSSPVSEFGMAVSATGLFMGDFSSVFSFPKGIGATAVEHGSAEGLTTTHLGYDLVFAGNSLFSVDSTTTTNVSRLFRIYDGATWGPTPWDLAPTYPSSSGSYAIATDGTGLFLTTRRTSVSANFYSFSTAAPGAPTLLGTNTTVWYVVGVAMDDQYFYVASNGTSGEGVYRVSRLNVSGAAQKIANVGTDTTCNNIELDAFAGPKYLYVRNDLGDVHAIKDPASASPVHVGAITTLGTTSDYAMTFDKADGVLYLFETETDSAGRIVMIQ